MPGVYRPYTLVDVLGTLNQQSTQMNGSTDMINGLGQFAETDETVSVADSMTTLVQPNPAWDAGIWGQFSWS